jgi:hypothetical protein
MRDRSSRRAGETTVQTPTGREDEILAGTPAMETRDGKGGETGATPMTTMMIGGRANEEQGSGGSGRSSASALASFAPVSPVSKHPVRPPMMTVAAVAARSSPSESEVGTTPGTANNTGTANNAARDAFTWNKAAREKSPPSETDSEQSNTKDERRRQSKLVHKEIATNLKAQARKHDSRTSLYRGVSLLRQTGKFHAQINVQRKQLHLGFFFSEEEAARAYDRAAIFKASVEGGAICTNMDINDYRDEIPTLQSMTQPELLQMLHEMKVKSNESSAPSSPRKGIKPRTSTNATKMAKDGGHKTSNNPPSSPGVANVAKTATLAQIKTTEKRSPAKREAPSSPRFDALSSAAGALENSVATIASSVVVVPARTIEVVDMHISKRRRTHMWPRRAATPAA